jgi:hypothetical protein
LIIMLNTMIKYNTTWHIDQPVLAEVTV